MIATNPSLATKVCSECNQEKIIMIGFGMQKKPSNICLECRRQKDAKKRINSGCDPKLAWRRTAFRLIGKQKLGQLDSNYQ